MQVFIYRDRGFTKELAERAAPAGYDALVLTTDNQMLGNRERDIRKGFSIPPKFGLMDMIAMAGKVSWLRRMVPELSQITFGNYVRDGEKIDIGSLAKRMSSLLDTSMSWKDVEWLRNIWKGPLILKGILHPDEATEDCARRRRSDRVQPRRASVGWCRRRHRCVAIHRWSGGRSGSSAYG